MTDNLIFLFNKLSYHIVVSAVNDEKVYTNKQRNERYFKKCIKRITQKGCDILLGKTIVDPPPDPCVTDYGGNWSPVTLLMDYANDYASKGANKYHDLLTNSVKCLQEGEYNCVNDLLKFLLLIKGPFFETHLQNDTLSMCRSEFFLSPMNSLTFLMDDPMPLLNGGLSRQTSFKKALKYEESWTKSFDSKFQVLGEYSKKNLLVPEKVSFDSLFSAKSTVASQSQSNSFVFTDFCIEKNYQSEKNIFDLNRGTPLCDIPLLDSFVDNPISHKLPAMLNSSKGISKSTYYVRSSDQVKRKLHLLKEEDQMTGTVICPQESAQSDVFSDEDRLSSKKSGIELKRNSNCSHSFAILYEKNMANKGDDHSFSSNDNFLMIKERRRNKTDNCVPSRDSRCSSKEIILGLWEHDKAILKEFRPELASSIPTLRMITMVEFVEDVKYLLTGINSGTFKFNATENCFHLEFGTCLSDVTPESLFYFSKDFMETGDYYVKLSACATEKGKSKFEACTSVSQALWKSIFDYLELHYSMVLAIPPTTNLMMLKSSVRDIHEMIMTVSNVCKVVKGGTLPEGGQLLTYLLETVEKINQPPVKNILFGILQNCCTVYFTCILQPWLFKGHLEKENNEFFIECAKQKMNAKSRNYYSSFYIVREKVPSFLLGFEESIFNCGKSVHFLKLFNAEDKFCQLLDKLNYPDMNLCLSDTELENLEERFRDYRNRVVDICGPSISIVNLRNEEKEKEKRFIEYLRECKARQEEERKLAKLRELEKAKAKKEMQNKLLNEEIKRMEEERERKRAEEEEAIKKIEEKIRQAEENERVKINQEKNLLRNYYDQLLKGLDTRLSFFEGRKKSLEEMLSDPSPTELLQSPPKTERILDILNDNAVDVKSQMDAETTKDEQKDETVDLNLNPIMKRSIETISNAESSQQSSPESRNANVTSVDENYNFQSSGENETVRNDQNEDNNNSGNGKNVEQEVRKSVSQRTLAATEAMRNKLKVMRSEFGIGHNDESRQVVKISQNNQTTASNAAIETHKESEYDILKCGSDLILVKPVVSQTEITKDNESKSPLEKVKPSETTAKSAESVCLKDALRFREVELERKLECIDLGNSLVEKSSEGSDVRASNSDSLSSFLTPPTFDPSEENFSVRLEKEKEAPEPEEIDLKCTESQGVESTSGLVLNPQYQTALIRDSEISNHVLVYEDIFQNLNPIEFDSIPCTELMKFQRFLRKSAQVPLVVQEKLANDALLKHLLIGENLLSHLKSLRGFFFLNDGEFGRSFTHNTFRSLAKCKESYEFFERSNLSDIVNEALNYTIHGSESNSQNLSFKIVKMPPFLNHSSHDVLSPFELSYRVEWPLNLILTEKALVKYKTVFRFLLKLKRINWTLNENCLFLNSFFKSRKFNGHVLAGSPHYHKIQIYRHAMAQVMITLDDYIFANGIQLPWINFLQDLETTANIDHLYQKHVRYIKDVLLRCFLSKNSKDLLGCIHNIIELALKFHYTTVSCSFTTVEGRYEHPKFAVLKATFNEFCSVIKTFLRMLKEKIAANQVIKSHYILIEKFDLKLT